MRKQRHQGIFFNLEVSLWYLHVYCQHFSSCTSLRPLFPHTILLLFVTVMYYVHSIYIENYFSSFIESSESLILWLSLYKRLSMSEGLYSEGLQK